MMIEPSLQCKPNVTGSGETNDDNNDFLNERGEQETKKSFIDYFPPSIWCCVLRRFLVQNEVVE